MTERRPPLHEMSEAFNALCLASELVELAPSDGRPAAIANLQRVRRAKLAQFLEARAEIALDLEGGQGGGRMKTVIAISLILLSIPIHLLGGHWTLCAASIALGHFQLRGALGIDVYLRETASYESCRPPALGEQATVRKRLPRAPRPLSLEDRSRSGPLATFGVVCAACLGALAFACLWRLR